MIKYSHIDELFCKCNENIKAFVEIVSGTGGFSKIKWKVFKDNLTVYDGINTRIKDHLIRAFEKNFFSKDQLFSTVYMEIQHYYSIKKVDLDIKKNKLPEKLGIEGFFAGLTWNTLKNNYNCVSDLSSDFEKFIESLMLKQYRPVFLILKVPLFDDLMLLKAHRATIEKWISLKISDLQTEIKNNLDEILR